MTINQFIRSASGAATLWLRIPGKGEVHVWTATQAAEASGLSLAVIRSLRARRKITTYNLGGTILFDAQEVLRYAQDHPRQGVAS